MRIPSTVLKGADQLLARRVNVRSTQRYCSSAVSSAESTDQLPIKDEDSYVFEAPEIFKETKVDIVRTRDARETVPKLEKDVIETMPDNVDWPSVWPAAATFDPNRVPLPVYQGAGMKQRIWMTRMDRWQNSELIKIPNFLHLTPEAIKRQTDAIRKFCTKWPKELTDERLDELYPVTVYTTDRVHASPSVRDPAARVVRLEIHISKLKMDEHAKDKFLQLVGPRYDPKTGMIRIETSDCPLKEQNLELSIYRLTACYFEAWVIRFVWMLFGMLFEKFSVRTFRLCS